MKYLLIACEVLQREFLKAIESNPQNEHFSWQGYFRTTKANLDYTAMKGSQHRPAGRPLCVYPTATSPTPSRPSSAVPYPADTHAVRQADCANPSG